MIKKVLFQSFTRYSPDLHYFDELLRLLLSCFSQEVDIKWNSTAAGSGSSRCAWTIKGVIVTQCGPLENTTEEINELSMKKNQLFPVVFELLAENFSCRNFSICTFYCCIRQIALHYLHYTSMEVVFCFNLIGPSLFSDDRASGRYLKHTWVDYSGFWTVFRVNYHSVVLAI